MVLKVGTDCSGIEAPIQALKGLDIQFHHVFSSDIDKYVIKSIKANYEPEIIFGDPDGPYPDGDITKRNIKDVPDIDLYIAGFPCQPFSMAGGRKGFEDTRGNVFFSCLEVIKEKKPKYFILENVKGLLSHDNKKTFKRILEELEKLEEYKVKWKLLNTKDYGIPQNRSRVFIVGINKKILIRKFDFPKQQPLQNILNFVDEEDNNIFDIKRKKNLDSVSTGAVFIDIDFVHYTSFSNANVVAPCILARSSLWCHYKRRYANIFEYLSLQGFPKTFKQTVSNTQLKKQIGNSMSVNVVEYIIEEILSCTKS